MDTTVHTKRYTIHTVQNIRTFLELMKKAQMSSFKRTGTGENVTNRQKKEVISAVTNSHVRLITGEYDK
jgi:hypothetical protein